MSLNDERSSFISESDTDEHRRLVLDKVMEPKPKITPLVYMLALSSCVGGFLFGYDTGVISGAMIFIKDDFVLNEWWQELVVSITILSAWIFSMVAGYSSDAWGRKRVIILASMIFTIGAINMAFAPNKVILLIGRFVVGSAVGFSSMCIPMYIAEASPARIRGSLVTLNNCFIAGGQFVAAIIAGLFSTNAYGWRYMLGLAAIPSVIQFICFLFLPESPRWLIRRGRYQDGLNVLHKLRESSDNVEEEFESIKDSCLQQERVQAESGGTSVFEQIFKDTGLRRALLVGCMLQMVQQICGINTVMYYSATIIQMSGVRSNKKAVWLAAATAAVNFVCNFIGFFLVEKIGRRLLTLVSLAGVIFSLGVLASGFQIAAMNSPSISWQDDTAIHTVCHSFSDCNSCTRSSSCGFCFAEEPNINGTCLLADPMNHIKSHDGLCKNGTTENGITFAYEWCPSSYSWIILAGLMLYLLFFSPGMGPMPWTINSEIYPLWARGVCYSISTSFNWFFNLLVSMTFLSLTQAITKYGAFWLYAGLASLGWIFFAFMLPETKGKPLEEVESLFLPDTTSITNIRNTATKSVKYVHIRGINREKTLDEQDSFDDS